MRIASRPPGDDAMRLAARANLHAENSNKNSNNVG
jgi:hypothetical protein